MKENDYIYLAKALNYGELCCLEDALKNFEPEYLKNERGEMLLASLRKKVMMARAWVHINEKTDRK